MQAAGTIFYDRIFGQHSDESFEKLALEIFRFQAAENLVYREFIRLLKIDPCQVEALGQIPFLPVELFKSQPVVSGKSIPEDFFLSSGTTFSVPGRHYIADFELYKKSIRLGFQQFFDDASSYIMVGLLPVVLPTSSIACMVRDLIAWSGHPLSGLYYSRQDELHEIFRIHPEKKFWIIGVTHALLDFMAAETHILPASVVVETGGMKGRGREMVRSELHEILRQGFGPGLICSEYGMTELLSQAWSLDSGLFRTPPWMKVIPRHVSNPLENLKPPARGCLNIIDLANVNSCSFLATMDIGVVHSSGDFEVLGRHDLAEVRGCNLGVPDA